MKTIFKKTLLSVTVLALTASVITGCSSVTSSKKDTETTVTEDSTDSSTDTSTIEADTSGTTTTEASADDVAAETSYPLTISNYSIKDGTWAPKDQVFDAVPQRVVATTQPTAELLIRLGLTDKIVGVAALYGSTPEDIAADFAKIPVLSEGYVGKEITIGANPDLILGRGELFAEADWGVGFTDDLNSMEIDTFALNTSRKGATLDDLFKDIKEIGEIFNVQSKANEFTNELKSRVEDLKTKLSGVKDPQTYAYVSVADGAISVYSGNIDTFQNDALNIMKLDNAFKDVTGEINQEQLIATNPNVLLVTYYTGGPDPQEMIQQIYDMPALQSLNAVKNKQIYVIDYNQFWAYGYQIFDGVEKLASEIYPDLFK